MFLSVGIVTHSSWIVNNSKQIRSRMKHMTSLGLSSDTQQTYDFATMYPSLNLDCMKKQLSEYTSLVFEHARQNIRPFNEPPRYWCLNGSVKIRIPGKWKARLLPATHHLSR